MKQRQKKEWKQNFKSLTKKMTKLSSFLYGNQILTMTMSDEMVYQMEAQLYAMQQYAKCLQKRLRIWGKTDKELRELNEAKLIG